jgi:hypothetical protein
MLENIIEDIDSLPGVPAANRDNPKDLIPSHAVPNAPGHEGELKSAVEAPTPRSHAIA